MKRSTAIVAAIVAVIIIVAAAAGVMLLNPGGETGSDQGAGTVPETRPIGPEGTVNGAVINIGTNWSNASAFAELMGAFNATSKSVKDPDALVQVAVTNNKTEDIMLDCANFTAKLDNGSEVQALNANSVTVEPNVTAYIVLGFQTNETNIVSVNYPGDNKLSMTVQSKMDRMLGTPKMMQAPENLTMIDNLTFQALRAWTVEQGDYSPMPLYFNESEKMVLVLVAGQNNNTTAMDLKPSSFWIDLGNGTWVQAEMTKNHNLPKSIQSDSNMAFLVGFRVNETTNPVAVYFWPDQASNRTVNFSISPQPAPEQTGGLMLSKVWTETGNNTTTIRVELMSTGADQAAVTLRGWSMKEGSVNAMMGQPDNATGMVYVFELKKGDDILLLQYEHGGQTGYLWLRPLLAA